MSKKRIKRSWKDSLFGSRKPHAATDRKRSRNCSLAIETLEPRAMMTATPLPVTFHIPQDVANRNVYVEISAQLQASYTNNHQTQMVSGDIVYFNNAIGDYDLATNAGGNFGYQLSGDGAQVTLPGVDVKSGQIVIGVGSMPVLSFTPGAPIAAPSPSANPDNTFGLFEYTIAGGVPDVDISEVDQVGVPFTITLTTPSPVSFPFNNGVGLTQTRGDMFNMFDQYIAAGGTNAAPFMQSITDYSGNRLTAPQDVIADSITPVSMGASVSGGGAVANKTNGYIAGNGTNYYYFVTATNTNVPSGVGETSVSNFQMVSAQLSKNGQNANFVNLSVTWNPFYLATGFNIYRGTTSDPTQAQYVGSAPGTATSFTDYGAVTPGAHPPTNSYTYNPLNSYFENAINGFFGLYDATNSFTIIRDGHTFTGQTNYSFNDGGNLYTVLDLTSPDFPSGQHFPIFKPFFSNNTNITPVSPAPSWLNGSDLSPGAMIMGASGVFGTAPTTLPSYMASDDIAIWKDLENSVDSAFNRGIANNPNLAPNNWANAPLLSSASAVPSQVEGQHLADDTYYYVVTATNGVPTTTSQTSETTASDEMVVTTSGSNNAATLSWSVSGAVVLAYPATSYNIYRSYTPGGPYFFVHSVDGSTTTWTDDGSYNPTGQRAPIYYNPGSPSNWYAAFLHQNSSTDPTSGISINGLAYGFPYDDQGSNAPNINAPMTAVAINLQSWKNTQDAPPVSDPNPGTGGVESGRPFSPASLIWITQPLVGRVNDFTTLEFKALGPHGNPFFGGTDITVNVIGVQGGTYVVHTDEVTGIGTLSFKNTKIGFNYIQATLENGHSFHSKIYQVLAKSVPLSLMHIFDKADDQLSNLSNDSFYKVIDDINRHRR